MAESGRPNYQEAAADLDPQLDRLRGEIAVIDRQVAELNGQIAALSGQREGLTSVYYSLSDKQESLRELASGVRTRERIQVETAEFPLIGAINATALDIINTTREPLQLARSLSDDDSVFSIPPHDHEPNTQVIVAVDETPTSPMAVVRVGTYGGTSMVLFDQGVAQSQADAIPAVSLHVGDGGIFAYNTEYARGERGRGIVLVQNQAKHPVPPDFSQSYDDPAAEVELATFLGEARYKAALSLLQPRQ